MDYTTLCCIEGSATLILCLDNFYPIANTMNEWINNLLYPFWNSHLQKIYPFSDWNTTTSHDETLRQEEQVVSSFSSVAVMLRIVPALPAARAAALGARRTVRQRSRAQPKHWDTLYVLLNRQSLQYRESVRYVYTFFWVFIIYSTGVKDKNCEVMWTNMIVLMWKNRQV